MKRVISFILCLWVALFLVPVQAESEYELETDEVCCELCCCVVESVPDEHNEEVPCRQSFGMFRHIIGDCAGLAGKMPPARILNCVFRE